MRWPGVIALVAGASSSPCINCSSSDVAALAREMQSSMGTEVHSSEAEVKLAYIENSACPSP